MKLMVLFFLLLQMDLIAQSLDTIVDRWHRAAAQADVEGYFGMMDEDFVFLGTAPGERWTKAQFSATFIPEFKKNASWDFKSSNRHWQFSKNKKMAWFDEDLSTWMEGCRGSGILVKKRGKWRFVYYNLTVLIENEKIREFIKIRKRPLKFFNKQ